MSVYVDDMYRYPLGQFGRMKMSHMVADTSAELIEMAKKVGLNPRWIQHAGTSHEHFDVSMSVREKVVAAGAKEVTMRDLAVMRRNNRIFG